MATMPSDVDEPSDAELIKAVRNGTMAAYGTLYERHVASARHLAHQLTRSSAKADDLVSEAFAKVLDALLTTDRPVSAFRAYLLTTLRNAAVDEARRGRKVDLVGGADDVEEDQQEPFDDPVMAKFERSLAAQAYRRLPERWRTVLWHVEVEGQSPAEVARILGVHPNAVSSLAYRAREGLRQRYLAAHLTSTTDRRCRAIAEKLGAWIRDGLSKNKSAQVTVHLDTCGGCRALADELADVNGTMRRFIAPAVLGMAAAGYLAAVGVMKGATATTAAVADCGTTVVVDTAGIVSMVSGSSAAGAAFRPGVLIGAGASFMALVAGVFAVLQSGVDNRPPSRDPSVTSTWTSQADENLMLFPFA